MDGSDPDTADSCSAYLCRTKRVVLHFWKANTMAYNSKNKSYTLDFVRQKGGELSIFCHQNLENNTLCLLQFKTKHVQEIILITY